MQLFHANPATINQPPNRLGDLESEASEINRDRRSLQRKVISFQEVEQVAPCGTFDSGMFFTAAQDTIIAKPAAVVTAKRAQNSGNVPTSPIASPRLEAREVSGSISTTCSVCLSDFDHGDIIRKVEACNHMFHPLCLERWLTRYQARCPLCKLALYDNPKGDIEL